VGTLRGFEHFSRAVSLDLSGVPALGSWEVGIVDGDQYAAAYIVQRGIREDKRLVLRQKAAKKLSER